MMKEYDGLHFLDKGNNSICLTDGKKVIKLIRAGTSENDAQRRYQQMLNEYGIFKEYLEGYTHNSSFFLDKSSSGWIVGIEQSFVTGTPLRRSLSSMNPAVVDFFNKTLHLYEERGQVPDLLPDLIFDPTGGVYLTGKFTYTSGCNVLMVENSPILIDTTLNKSLRSRIWGPILRPVIAARIRIFLRSTGTIR